MADEPTVTETPEAEPKVWSAEDVGKLQAKLNSRADTLANQLKASEEARTTVQQRLQTVEAEIEELKVTDEPDAAAYKRLRKELVETKQAVNAFQLRGWNLAVENAALKLQGEFELSEEEREEIAAKLATTSDESQLKAAVKEERADRKLAAAETATAKAAKGKPEVDAGRGTATSKDVVSEMRDTPLKEWANKSEQFRRRAIRS
jgi:chromosome segregation ATPase